MCRFHKFWPQAWPGLCFCTGTTCTSSPVATRHPRYIAKGTVSRQPEQRAAQLAAVSGNGSPLSANASICWRPGRRHCSSARCWCTVPRAPGIATFQAAVAAHTCTTEYVVRWVPERGSETARDQLHRSEETVIMAPYRAAIVYPGVLWDTTCSEKTPHRAAMNDFFSVTDLIRV